VRTEHFCPAIGHHHVELAAADQQVERDRRAYSTAGSYDHYFEHRAAQGTRSVECAI
jgi:hypothetical protein